MKKNFKSLVLGIVIGATLVSLPAMADAIWEKIEVLRNGITVMVDGEKLEADNFLYRDTTYVPIRAVAEALGRNVSYKDGVAYIEDKFSAEFGGEKVDLGNGVTATTEEISAYKTLQSKDNRNLGATDEQFHNLATENIRFYYGLSKLAAENNIYIGQEFFDEFENIMAYNELNYGGKDALYAVMDAAGYSYEMYKRTQETEYLYSKLLQCDAFAVTDEDVTNYYAENADKFPYDGVQAKHVLISTMDENGKAITDVTKLKAIEKKANDVYRLASGGADFDKLVAEYGEDPGMVNNTEGYTFTKGEMAEEFEATAFALKDGQISKPVKTSYGYHIIKKVKTVKVQPLTEDMFPGIKNAIQTERIEAAVNARK